MATEVLQIPEEYIKDVIKVIREGLDGVSMLEIPRTSPVRKQLTQWCNEMEEYINHG